MIRDTFDLIYSMNLRLPTRYLLLDRAIATLASVGVELYPDFNVFEVAKPYARAMMIERFTPDKIASRARREGLRLSEMALELPYQVHDVLEEMRDGQIEVGFVHKGLDEFMHRIDVVFNRLVIALVVTGGLIGSSLIGIFAETGPQILGLNVALGGRVRPLSGARRLALLGRAPERPALASASSSAFTRSGASFCT